MAKDYQSKIGKAAVWSSVTEILSKLISPVVNIVLARLLAPEAFGAVATITMVISFAEVFTDAGFQKYIVQREFSTEEELNNSTNVAFWTNFALSSLICIGFFFFRDPIAALVGSPELGDSISVASLLILVAAFSSMQMARYKRVFDFKTLFFVRIGVVLIPLVVTIPLAILLKNYWALLIGTMVSQLFSAVALTIKSQWRPRFYYSFRLLKEMLSFTIWTLLESISVWLTNYIDIFMVGSVLTSHYLGLYRTATTTVNSYMGIITASIMPVVFSALSRYQSDDKNFRKTYYSFQRLTAVLVIPMGIGIFLFSDLVTQILLGDQWMEASNFIGWWGLTSSITIVLSYFGSEVYRSKGKPIISFISQLIHLAFVIPTVLISLNYTFEIFCISRALVRLQGVLVGILIMRFIFKFRIRELVKNLWPMVLCACIMGAVGYLLKPVVDSMVWQLGVVLLCVIVYFGALFVLFPHIRREVLTSELTQKLLQKFRKHSKT